MRSNTDSFAQFVIGDLRVHLVPDDIANVSAAVIVSSDDADLSMSGGVSRAILQRAGAAMRQEALAKNSRKVGEVVVSSAGNLDCENIFHAIVVDYSTGELPGYELVMSLTRTCLDLANGMGHSSIAIPPMGAGAGRLAPTESAEAIVEGIARWSSESPVTVEDVYIATLDVQQETLRSFLESLIEHRVRNSYEKRLVAAQARVNELEEKLDGINRASLVEVPHPIAFIRAKADIGGLASQRAWDLCNSVEAMVRYAVSIMIAISRDGLLHTEGEKGILNRPLTFGKWIELLREYSRTLRGNTDVTIMKNIAEFYAEGKGASGRVAKFINSTVTLRNKMAHPPGGVRPDELTCETFEEQLRSGVDTAINELVRCLPGTLLVIKSIEGFGSGESIRYSAGVLNGESSLFKNVQIESPDKLSPGTVGIWSDHSKSFLKLYPLITYRKCPTCQLDDVFFLDEIRGTSVGRWWNYTDGHVIQEPLLDQY